MNNDATHPLKTKVKANEVIRFHQRGRVLPRPITPDLAK